MLRHKFRQINRDYTAANLRSILAYAIRNEFFYETNAAPLNWATGRVQTATGKTFSLAEFAAAFLNEYWLHFELTSVLLLAAVIAAIAVIRANREDHG